VKKVKVEDAVGMILCHDLTKIVPGVTKDAAFRKGHVIKVEDIPELLSMGKAHIYVWETNEGMVHEDDAAIRMAKGANRGGIRLTEPKEGKVNLHALEDGLLKIDILALEAINSVEDMVFATLHNNRMVKAGEQVAGCRVVPLTIEEEKLIEVEAICAKAEGVIEVKPLKKMKAGLITTGSEVFFKRIPDKFGPVIRKKLEDVGSELEEQVFVNDDAESITAAILDFKAKGYDLIILSGGMSVDPDDLTPTGIRNSGAKVITYGAPVLPGAMFMLAYLDETPILGLPGCVMYARTTIFDLLFPRMLVGEALTKADIVKLGHGGLCLNCPECIYPHCPFGK
jgi:molybdenum cofactor synthesis domain-containing protein